MNKNIYEEKYKILKKDTETSGIMKISAMFDCLHEVADHSLIPIGLDRASLEKRGILWVLGGQTAEICELPRLDEEVIIKTWVGKDIYNFIPRYYQIEKDNTVLVKVSTMWAVIDKSTRKSLSLKESAVQMETCITGDEIPVLETPKKLDITSTFNTTVSASNLDFNNHMNNAQYLEIINTFNPFFLSDDIQPKKIIARYSSEAFEGDMLTIKEGVLNSSRYYSIDSIRGNHLKLRIEY